MNKKQNDISKCKLNFFFIWGAKLLTYFILYDFGIEKKHFWCLLFIVWPIVYRKIIYYWNNDVILNSKHNKAC